MKKLINGFTLIELMIVIAIIGILAAVALPAYQQHENGPKKNFTVHTANNVTINGSSLQNNSNFGQDVNVVATSIGDFTNVNLDVLGVTMAGSMKVIADSNIGNSCVITYARVKNPKYNHLTKIECGGYTY